MPKQVSEVWTDNFEGIAFCKMGVSRIRQPLTPPLTVIVLYLHCVVSADVGIEGVTVKMKQIKLFRIIEN